MTATSSAECVAALERAGRAVLDLLLPIVCAACDRPLHEGERGIICGRCWSRLRTLPAPRCDRCGHPRRNVVRCQWCELLPPFVRAARSVAWTAGSGSAIVHALKYHGWHRTADQMAARMARLSWPADVERERTALVPVPLAADRQRERGFNQSAALATGLSQWWNVPVWTTALERTRTTASQTRLTPGQRLGNVSGAFRVAATMSRDALRGTHPVLVDDVVTTGATLAACAAALLAGGARIVSVVTFARAPAQGDRA